MTQLDPYDVPSAVRMTSLEALDQDPLYSLAIEIANDVQAMYSYVRERPRYEAIFDQAARASSSVALNIAQGHGKLRGFLANDLLCSRGEAYELYAALSIIPKDVAAPVKDKLKNLLQLLDRRILEIPVKPR